MHHAFFSKRLDHAIHVRMTSLLIVCFLLIHLNSKAQTLDSTIHELNEVTVFESKQKLLQSSKKITLIDSMILSKYNTSSLADLLTNQSAIHIKSYGNGNMATTAMRGGNANHTALLWNGLNIQNAMLGQPDLSIIPAFLFDHISLEYGGGSSMWGSGAIGGSIHLTNNLSFNKGLKTKTSFTSGSFNTKKITSSVLLSYKKIVSHTRIYYNTSENNYNYLDTTDKEQPSKRITHANYLTKGLMQEFSFFVNTSQKIILRGWYNHMFRNLPSYSSIVVSKQHQLDENLKISADWNYSKRNINSTIRAAYFNDALNYTDSVISIFSKSNVKTIIAESDNMYTYKNHTFNFGINSTNYQSTLFSTEGNKDTVYHHSLSKLALFAAYKIHLFHSKLNYNVSVRKEFTTQINAPFTGNMGLHYQFTKYITSKLNANKSFRQPTLNDLYWNPGGNPNLKPEESTELDGGIEFNYKKNNISCVIEATYFNRHTTNWIIWLPSNNTAYWSPQNIAEVYSRGTETKTELGFTKKQWQIKCSVNTSYVLSTNQKQTSENDNSVGRQLIYAPRYNGNANVLVGYKNIKLLFNQNYTGYRFTSTDNTSWLNPYYIASVKASYSYTFKSTIMELFGSINNVFNKNYVVVMNRPMPLRNFELGLSLQYHKQKNNQNPK